MTSPISSKKVKKNQQVLKPKAQQQKTKNIGGVEYKADQVESYKEYKQDGQLRYSVMLKPGVNLDYPTQTDKSKSPHVESRGLSNKWYNPDESWVSVFDIDNATITGSQNLSDQITLEGKASNNTVIVNQRESWYINGDMRHDVVTLGPDTSGNTVEMDDKDRLQIMYNDYHDENTGLNILTVTGSGTSEQEVQLKHDIGPTMFNYHKSQQQ
jgi:hypothetical protein